MCISVYTHTQIYECSNTKFSYIIASTILLSEISNALFFFRLFYILHFPKYITHNHKDLKAKNNDSKANPRIAVPSYALRWQGHLRLFRLWMPCLSGCHSHYIHECNKRTGDFNFLGIQQSRDSKGPGIQSQNLFWLSLMPTVTNTHWG